MYECLQKKLFSLATVENIGVNLRKGTGIFPVEIPIRNCKFRTIVENFEKLNDFSDITVTSKMLRLLIVKLRGEKNAVEIILS